MCAFGRRCSELLGGCLRTRSSASGSLHVGDACTAFGDCDGTSHCVDRVCVADQSNGPCTQDNHCLGANRCDYTLKRCVPLLANGEPCESFDQCLGGQCYELNCRTWTVAGANSCLGVLDD